jgi:hypothetical protein
MYYNTVFGATDPYLEHVNKFLRKGAVNKLCTSVIKSIGTR